MRLEDELLTTPPRQTKNQPWWLRLSVNQLKTARRVHAYYRADQYPNHTLGTLASALGKSFRMSISETSLRRFFEWAEGNPEHEAKKTGVPKKRKTRNRATAAA